MDGVIAEWGDTGRMSVSPFAPTHEAHLTFHSAALLAASIKAARLGLSGPSYWSIRHSDPCRIDALGDDAFWRRSSHSGEQATRIMGPGAGAVLPAPFGGVLMKASVRAVNFAKKSTLRGRWQGRIAQGFLKLSAESLAAPDPR
jgi:hypothetical protein